MPNTIKKQHGANVQGRSKKTMKTTRTKTTKKASSALPSQNASSRPRKKQKVTGELIDADAPEPNSNDKAREFSKNKRKRGDSAPGKTMAHFFRAR